MSKRADITFYMKSGNQICVKNIEDFTRSPFGVYSWRCYGPTFIISEMIDFKEIEFVTCCETSEEDMKKGIDSD